VQNKAKSRAKRASKNSFKNSENQLQNRPVFAVFARCKVKSCCGLLVERKTGGRAVLSTPLIELAIQKRAAGGLDFHVVAKLFHVKQWQFFGGKREDYGGNECKMMPNF